MVILEYSEYDLIVFNDDIMDVDGCLWHCFPTFFTSTDFLMQAWLPPPRTKQFQEVGRSPAVPWFFFVRKPAKNMRENIAETWVNHGQNPRNIGFTLAKLWRVIGKMWRTNRTEHPLNCLKLTLRLTKFLGREWSSGSEFGGVEVGQWTYWKHGGTDASMSETTRFLLNI